MRLLVVYGPTAVGKTKLLETLLVEFRNRVPALGTLEVISADSMQVYRGLDIGTAKPAPELRARIPHHLIDIRNPDERYDVAAFVTEATRTATAIRSRGSTPVVSGGTAYYIKHLLLGLPEAPAADPQVRELIRNRAQSTDPAQLHNELRAVDPESAARINVNDTYRVTRALEVFEQSGRPLSSYARNRTGEVATEAILVRLIRDRSELRDRIGERVRSMFGRGLRSEVERLVAAGYTSTDPGMRAIGYREFFEGSGKLRPASADRTIEEEIIISTAKYAKRQESFFRQLARALPVHEIVAGGDAAKSIASLWTDSEG